MWVAIFCRRGHSRFSRLDTYQSLVHKTAAVAQLASDFTHRPTSHRASGICLAVIVWLLPWCRGPGMHDSATS